MLYNSWQLS